MPILLSRRTALALPLAAAIPAAGRAAEAPLTVFAAASLTDAMRDLDPVWQNAGHPALRLTFAASSTLARQIEAGAPANVFASADQQWADDLDKKGLLAPGTRRNLLGNDLVLVVPKDRAREIRIERGMDLTALLGPDGRIATGDPAHVPVGLYARQALTRLGLWDSLVTRIAAAADVRSALLLVERGEAPAGIVYRTDAAASSDVAVAGTFPADSHDPVTYPFAVVKAGDTPEARALLAFLAGPDGQAAFSKRGFTLV